MTESREGHNHKSFWTGSISCFGSACYKYSAENTLQNHMHEATQLFRTLQPTTIMSHAGSQGKGKQWEVRMLYDGACPLCKREVDFLM